MTRSVFGRVTHIEGDVLVRPLIAVLGSIQQSEVGDFSLRDAIPRAYSVAIDDAGGVPFIVPCLEESAAIEALLSRADGLVITGGADISPDEYDQQPIPQLGAIEPLRDRLDQVAVRYMLEHPDLPVIGICRGIQSMAVFGGGALTQDIPSQVAGAIQHNQKAPGWHGIHEITIEGGSLLTRITGRAKAMVNSFHHQAVSEVPEGFVATAWTEDGVIEAMERSNSRFCLGMQFHPELMAPKHPFIAAIFAAFVQAAMDR